MFLDEKGFLPIKEARLLHCKDGMFLGWEDFSPELIKKIMWSFLDMLGFFVVILCFHEL